MKFNRGQWKAIREYALSDKGCRGVECDSCALSCPVDSCSLTPLVNHKIINRASDIPLRVRDKCLELLSDKVKTIIEEA